MGRQASRVVIVTHSDPRVAGPVLVEALKIFAESGVQVCAPDVEFEKNDDILKGAGASRIAAGADELGDVDLCLVLGGDGTMLRAFRLVRGSTVPVAGVNLGKVGFLTTVDAGSFGVGVQRLLAGDFEAHPLLGLEAESQDGVFRAVNDVVVTKRDRSTACRLALSINGVSLFEVSCDGVVVATPAGSSAYSLAAGGPLLGISVDAYVISLVAAHAVGVRPVVAGPSDILEIANIDQRDCVLDIDGQRATDLPAGSVVRVHTVPDLAYLGLLEGDSLYHHFRDRLL